MNHEKKTKAKTEAKSILHFKEGKSGARSGPAVLRGITFTPMSRSAIPCSGNDDIMTPDPLALAIVEHFKPRGVVCDPCDGTGAFMRAFKKGKFINKAVGFDIKRGFNFLEMGVGDGFDWIITNPPWGKMGDKRKTKKRAAKPGFLSQAMRFADDVVFLIHINAMFTNARRRMLRDAGFHLRELAECERPWQWRSMGLQLAAIHFSKTPGPCKISWLDYDNTKPQKQGHEQSVRTGKRGSVRTLARHHRKVP